MTLGVLSQDRGRRDRYPWEYLVSHICVIVDLSGLVMAGVEGSGIHL